MHIGVSYRNVNRSNSFFVLGLYRSVSIINLSRILPMLKRKFFFFFRFMLRTYSKVLLITGMHIDYSSCLLDKLSFFSMDYFFGRWWNGYIKNFKVFTKARLTPEDNIKITRLPAYIFYAPLNDQLNDVSGYAASREFISAGIHSLVFFDSHKNINLVKAGVMMNTKGLLNNYFLIYLIFAVRIKVLLTKKKNFFKNVMESVDYSFTEIKSSLFNFVLHKNSSFNSENYKLVLFQYEQFLHKKINQKTFFYKNIKFFKTWKDFLK